ncbi:MAG: tetratricopeptide repeat protein, partial [Thermodesulfovibrionales bacterium]
MTDYDRALELSEKALEMAGKIGAMAEVAKSYNQLGIIHQKRGDYDQAFQYHQKALEIAEKIADQAGISRSFHQIGIVHQKRG